MAKRAHYFGRFLTIQPSSAIANIIQDITLRLKRALLLRGRLVHIIYRVILTKRVSQTKISSTSGRPSLPHTSDKTNGLFSNSKV